MSDPTDPDIDVNEVRVRESGCAECDRLRNEAAALAAALRDIWATTSDGEASIDALQRWVRS